VAISLRRWLEDERPWAVHAACRDADPALFFAGVEGGDTRVAQRICAGCPVNEECLEWALTAGVSYGVWGGTTEQQRRQAVRRSA
jgi:WhiB family redox-sensing transcriptional regulator